jgi:hypothetical protein
MAKPATTKGVLALDELSRAIAARTMIHPESIRRKPVIFNMSATLAKLGKFSERRANPAWSASLFHQN